MALGNISIIQKPALAPITTATVVLTNWTPVVGYTIYQDDITDLFYFKLILEVRIDDASGTLLGKIKQKPNGYAVDGGTKARAFFDIREIVNEAVAPTLYDQNITTAPYKSIHKIGANNIVQPFSKSGDALLGLPQVAKIFVKAYQEYSESATVSPSEDTSPNVDDTGYYITGSIPLMQDRGTDFATNPTQVQQGSFMFARNNASIFLTDVMIQSDFADTPGPYGWYPRNFVRDGDYHTLAFLNDSTLFGTGNSLITIKYYDSSGAQIPSAGTETIAQSATYGGASPGSVTLSTQRLLYFGCGPANLEAQTANSDLKPSAYDGWEYYTVQGSTTSTPIIFIKSQDCGSFLIRRIAWRNSWGTWDYYNFTKKNTRSVSVKRKTYSKMLGNFNEQVYYYNDTDTGKSSLQVDAVLKETLESDWIYPDGNFVNQTYTGSDPSGYSSIMQSLFLSDSVYIIENSDTEYTVPVVITNTSFVRKTTRNDGLIKYTLNIEYSNPLNTNS